MMQRIDHRVSRNKDAALRHALRDKIRMRRRSRREVQCRDAAREASVHLLRKGGIDIVRPKSRLNMPDGNLMIVRGKRAGKGRRCIAVDEDKIGAVLLEHLVDAHHCARCDVKERLPCRHDIQIVIGNNVEETQHLIEHLTVLRRDERPRFDLICMTHELHDNGRHLNRLGTRAKDRHDFDFAGHSSSAPLWNEIVKVIFAAAHPAGECPACAHRQVPQRQRSE